MKKIIFTALVAAFATTSFAQDIAKQMKGQTYAEATARLNGNSTTAEGTAAINALRARANNGDTKTVYSLGNILDEWQKEFYFEGRRRVDLIRFDQFGGPQATYKWAWKGGDANGTVFPKTRNIFAIPATEINASNGAIKQNDGY